MAVFMVGGIAVVASIIRLYALWAYTVSKDVAYDAIFILLLSQIEINVAIISASAPSFRPLFSKVFAASIPTASHKNSASTGSTRPLNHSPPRKNLDSSGISNLRPPLPRRHRATSGTMSAISEEDGDLEISSGRERYDGMVVGIYSCHEKKVGNGSRSETSQDDGLTSLQDVLDRTESQTGVADREKYRIRMTVERNVVISPDENRE